MNNKPTLMDLIEKTELGIHHIKVNDINELTTFFELTAQLDLIWRGQMLEKWKLESTLARLQGFPQTKKSLDSLLEIHLDRFKFSSRGRRGTNPLLNIDDDEWWALGQHYGLATPLLDWTFSPYVAAFFAFSNEISETDKDDTRVVYGLDRKFVEELSSVAAGFFKDDFEEVRFIKPYSNENTRLINQNGLFSFGPLTTDLESWLRGVYGHLSDRGTIPNAIMPKTAMFKLLISNNLRKQILIMLNRMNINYLTLYPDLEGASLHSNMSLSIKRYAFD